MRKLIIFLICWFSLIGYGVYSDEGEFDESGLLIDAKGDYCLRILQDSSACTHTKVVYEHKVKTTEEVSLDNGYYYPAHYMTEYLILDISDTGEVKVLKRYTEKEWEELIK